MNKYGILTNIRQVIFDSSVTTGKGLGKYYFLISADVLPNMSLGINIAKCNTILKSKCWH
jgi:hypothetical protein